MSDKEPTQDGEVLPMVHDLLKNSSSHGLPNIYASQSILGRVFWTAVFCVGLFMMSWQVHALFVDYFEYEYIVGIEVRFNRTLPFPAVTICNLNPVLQSKLEAAGTGFRDKFDAKYVPEPGKPQTNDDSNNEDNNDGNDNEGEGAEGEGAEGAQPAVESTTTSMSGGKNVPGSGSSTTPRASPSPSDSSALPANSTSNGTLEPIKSWDDLEKSDYFSAQSAEYKLKNQLAIALSGMPLNQKREMGHTIQSMLLDCSWLGYQCSPANFTTFYHYQYGNCYTFNNGKLFPVVTTSKPGPHYGLSLELFINQDEYMEDITDSAGLRISVHEPNRMPFPEDDGLSIGPGQRTSISTRVLEIDRLGPPWGDCTDADIYNTDNVFINNYAVKYSKQACERSCYQYAVIKECNCADTHFPFPPERDVRPCDTEDNEWDQSCVVEMERKYDESELMCNCNQTCHDTVYIPSVSQSVWPSMGYQNKLFNRMGERNADMREQLEGTAGDQWTKRNVAKLDVYFMEFNYQHIKQSPATTVMDLLSNIGGQLGLWIGVSVVTLMEMMQLVGAVFGAMLGKVHRPQRTGPSTGPVKTSVPT